MTTTELTQKIDEAQAALWAVKGLVQDIQEVGRRDGDEIEAHRVRFNDEARAS